MYFETERELVGFDLDPLSPTADESLVALYGPGEPGGPVLQDMSAGRGNDAPFVGASAAWALDSHRGWTLDVDNDSYADTGVFADPRSITLAFWIKYHSIGGSQQATGAHDGSNRTYVAIIGATDDFFVGIGDTFVQETPSGVVADIWYHFTVTGDGTTATIYIDGVNKQTFGYSASAASTNAFWIGARNHAAEIGINGQLDDFRIYNRGLSAAEAQHIHQSTLGSFPSDIAMPPRRVVKAAAAGFVPYPYPRHELTGGLAT